MLCDWSSQSNPPEYETPGTSPANQRPVVVSTKMNVVFLVAGGDRIGIAKSPPLTNVNFGPPAVKNAELMLSGSVTNHLRWKVVLLLRENFPVSYEAR